MEKRSIKLNTILIGILTFIFPILIFVSGEVRPSISNYVYSDSVLAFSMLLTIAAVVFIYNHIQDDRNIYKGYAVNTKWYNLISGICLLGVVATPHLDYGFIHYVFAGLFFLSQYISIVLFSNAKHRLIKFIGCIIGFICLILPFFNVFSLALGEQIALLPITLNLLLELYKITD